MASSPIGAGLAPPRLLGLSDAHNFRDLGGYRTSDGRRLRWRVIFRSGAMAELGADDTRILAALNIATICDLRTNAERSRKPTLWHLDLPTTLIARDHTTSSGALLDVMRHAAPEAASMRAVMTKTYRDLPYEQADAYARLFGCIAAGKLPLVFNCAAGKDRTGVAAALLLDIVGVDRRIILEDYLLTNAFVDRLMSMLAHDPIFGPLLNNHPDVAAPLLRAEPEYLEAMFATIEARHGSVAGYLEDGIGVGRDRQDQIRLWLLEEAGGPAHTHLQNIMP